MVTNPLIMLLKMQKQVVPKVSMYNSRLVREIPEKTRIICKTYLPTGDCNKILCKYLAGKDMKKATLRETYV